jgi:two-component system, OmpR family, phosphate regulon sensor histidine kinase PhoR
MKITRQTILSTLRAIFTLLLLAVMFVAGFFLMNYVYRLIDLHPAPWLAQLIDSFVGLILLFLAVYVSLSIARAWGWMPERNVFKPIIEALEQIAAGDFSIRVDNKYEDNEMVGELATRVNKVAAELDQMENLRQEFISNVSHEIQSPLTSINGFTRALEDDQLSAEERHHYLGIIETESMRLSRITQDLLKMASLESDQVRFEPKPYRLDKQIRDLILASEPQWQDKGIEMDVSLAETEITADEDLLSQVWTNLIHNSIKFTPQGGKISIALRPRGEQIEFEITDTGIGISKEDQERVFERFFKADPARTRAAGGSGLGLSIAKKIVEMHHGTIGVQSELGAGATFTVVLPVK